MSRPDWISRAKPVDPVSVDVVFLVSETFYYGPENGFTAEQWETLREPLYSPKVDRYGKYVLSEALDGSADELVRYYQDVVRLAARHRKELKTDSSYFWIRPLIFARGELDITFPWYDTWAEAAPVLDALASPDDGQLFRDMDQGWDFEAFAEAERLFLRRGNSDSGEDLFIIATRRAAVMSQIPTVRGRVERLLQQLTAAMGRDYWSR